MFLFENSISCCQSICVYLKKKNPTNILEAISKKVPLYLQLFHWAQRNADHIVPLYCFDPRHYMGTYHYNLPKTGPFRLRFLLESIKDLRNTLLNKGRWVHGFPQFLCLS